MKTQSFDVLVQIIEEKKLPDDCRPTPFQVAFHAIVMRDSVKFSEVAKQFTLALSQNQSIHIHPDLIISNMNNIALMICKHNKLFSFKGQQFRGFTIVGKTVNVYKGKKGKQAQQLQHRQQFSSLVEQGTIRLFQDNKWILQKQQKNHNLNDILLQHDMPDGSIDEVCLNNQAFSPFVPVQKSIIMLIPSKIMRPECMSFLKSSLLHVYLDQASLISKIITKQLFYKGSCLRGIFFIQQGEVEVKSGRMMARGWTTFGKVKVSGFGWKFKPIPFIRFLSKNSSIWKQFINDLKMNHEYPFNIIHILGLDDEDDFTNRAEWKGLGRKKLGNRSNKLPKILHRSVDEAKYQEIQKLKHYDNRINDIFIFKQDLLTRKLKGVVHGKFQPFYRDEKVEKSAQKKRNMIIRMNSKQSQFAKKQTQPDSQPTENILIMSVLKRLQSIADIDEVQKRKGLSISYESSLNRYHHKTALKLQSKRQGMKISPMQAYESAKYTKKNQRYK